MAHDTPAHGNDADMKMSFVNSSLLGVAISLPIIASIAVGLRLYARRLKGHTGIKTDDWTLWITLIMCWAHSINTIIAGVVGGIGTITLPPREYANVALRTLWVSSFFLITALYTVKLSILFFYHHLFSINDSFRRACYFMVGILTLWWISSITIVLLSTDPFDAAWRDASRARHRFDFNAWYVTYSGLSIFFDVVILCFPIPMVRSLRVNTRQKISILGIFWLGGFVCISAIVRFVFLYNSIYQLTDFGQNRYSKVTAAFIWAEIEPNCSVIAACLPTYGPFFKEGRFLPGFFRSLRSKIGLSPTSRHMSHPIGTSHKDGSAYYELSKTAGSKKGTGEISHGRGSQASLA
ncbi:hypothetical protein BDV95DRAFT_214116 [Massariosphaeria phaeospora]|uniref:Rhodopsin domain-containing protein n=1 Tax=Massariosphaeria phaeospora TaxID=100035 RepID=A0A7C8I676_9PLEO|nr:hypothetical protein BDV95DRAFT_214116 [Massariosphaeria phaeospora]